MKTKLMTFLMLMMWAFSFSASAKSVTEHKKEKSEVTFLVSMKCEKCQKRIENTLSFEKGVTGLDVNLPKKTVTIEYRDGKTSPEKLKEAIQKLGYTVAPLPAASKANSQQGVQDKKKD